MYDAIRGAWLLNKHPYGLIFFFIIHNHNKAGCFVSRHIGILSLTPKGCIRQLFCRAKNTIFCALLK